MSTHEDVPQSGFSWNAGGWFGSQLGSTVWMVILGLILLHEDVIAAAVCLVSFTALNAWGLSLWRRRQRLSAYAGLQWFFLAATLVFIFIAVIVNVRGVAGEPAAGAMISTHLPYGVIAIPPALMLLFFFLRQQMTQR